MGEPKLFRDASARLTFAIDSAMRVEFPALCSKLTDAFGLSPDGDLVTDGIYVVFRQYRRGMERLELSWDDFMGFAVTAITPEAEPLVGEIARYLVAM